MAEIICNGMWNGFGYWTMGFGWLFMTLTTIAIILLIIWLIKQIQK